MNAPEADEPVTLNATNCAHHRHLDGAVLKTMPCVVLEENEEFDTGDLVGIHPETGRPVPILTFDDGSHAHYLETREVAVYRMAGQ